jgi:hypothetical protein
MRSMRSCFFPDLLSIVQHSSLKPEMICLSRSTVLSLTLTLRPYRITVEGERDTRRGEERPTSKSAQGSTTDMTKANETKGRTANWAVALLRLALATQPQTHVTLPRDHHVLLSRLGRLRQAEPCGERDSRQRRPPARGRGAGGYVFHLSCLIYSPNLSLSSPLFLETISARCRHCSSRS